MIEKKPVQAGYVNSTLKTGNTIVNNVVTASDVAVSYDKLWYDATKAIYGVARDFIAADQAIELRKEQNRIAKNIMDERANFAKEWDSPEKINYNDKAWVEEKNNQLAILREKEFRLIASSRLENPIKDKLAMNSNDHYTEAHLKHQFDFGDFTRKTNISAAQKEIEDNLALIGHISSDAEKDMLINSINNSREILLNYSVDPTMVDSKILDGLADNLTAGTKDMIDSFFDSNGPDAAYAMANDYLVANSQRYVSLIGRVDGLKDQDAGKMADIFYEKQKQTYRGYIDRQRKSGLKRLEVEARQAERKAAAEKKRADKTYIKGAESISESVSNADKERRLANDWEGVVKNYIGSPYTTDEFLNDPQTFEFVYGSDIDEAGLGQGVYKVLDKSDRNMIKESVKKLRDNDIPEEQIYRELIQPYVQNKSGGEYYKEALLVKDIAEEIGVNPAILFSEEATREKKFKVDRDIRKGKKSDTVDINVKAMEGKVFKTKGSKRYEALLAKVGNNEINKQKLDKWIQGKLLNNPRYEKKYEMNPDRVIRDYLAEDEIYNEIEGELQEFYNLEIKETSQYKKVYIPQREEEKPKEQKSGGVFQW